MELNGAKALRFLAPSLASSLVTFSLRHRYPATMNFTPLSLLASACMLHLHQPLLLSLGHFPTFQAAYLIPLNTSLCWILSSLFPMSSCAMPIIGLFFSSDYKLAKVDNLPIMFTPKPLGLTQYLVHGRHSVVNWSNGLMEG